MTGGARILTALFGWTVVGRLKRGSTGTRNRTGSIELKLGAQFGFHKVHLGAEQRQLSLRVDQDLHTVLIDLLVELMLLLCVV